VLERLTWKKESRFDVKNLLETAEGQMLCSGTALAPGTAE